MKRGIQGRSREGSRISKGRSIRNLLNLEADEKIAAVLRLEFKVDEDSSDITFREDAGFVFFATRSGKVKKTALNDFRNCGSNCPKNSGR